MFKIIKKDRHSNARLGVLTTPHGIVKTPSYVIVATRGEIKCLKPSDIKRTKTQIVIANTFHLWKVADKKPLRLGKTPTMTDSGGFQVLSLAFSDKNKVGKFMTGSAKKGEILKRDKIWITSKGIYFTFDGKKMFLGPELSIKLQQKIGADIIFAFDHITSPLDTYEYNKKAVALTDKWARICLESKIKNLKSNQQLFGIVQGGLFRDLRIKSAKSIGAMPFDGFGIGGSYTKKQIAKVLKWVIPYLPEEKPRHLLGVGKIEDIFEAVENGVDLFDCVIPTREARHGRIWTAKGHYDIRKSGFRNKKTTLEKGCKCPTCRTISQARLYSLFRNPATIANAQRRATIHNVYFFNDLVEKIRESIAKNKFKEFKNKFLAS